MATSVRTRRARRLRRFLTPLLRGQRALGPQPQAAPDPCDGPGAPDVWLAGLRLR